MSLGKDLASIRKELGLTLEDIQSSVKIPVHTLKSIENDSIHDDSEHNETYVRIFIRSYAKALKIDDLKIISALDDFQAGKYSGELLSADYTQSLPQDHDTEEKFSLSKLDAPEIKQELRSPTPKIETVNWADMGKKFTLQQTTPRTWIVGILIFVLIILTGLGIYFREEIMDQFSSEADTENSELPVQNTPELLDSPDPVPQNNQGNINVDSSITESLLPEPEDLAEVSNQQENMVITQNLSSLSDTLTVTVYAAFDKLEPVRVTSDLNWRTNPFWMEARKAYNFEFSDTLLVRGQYNRMLLLFNGHVIENPRQNYFNSEFNSVMITRDIVETDRFMQAAPEEFPYDVGAPDSFVKPIDF